MLESLAGDDDIGACRRDFAPVIRIGKDDIDIRTRCEIDADLFPGRQREERTVTPVDVLAAKIEDDERFRSARLQIIAPESRHLVERALVHACGSEPCLPVVRNRVVEKRLAFSA